jgi:hypothetical protein
MELSQDAPQPADHSLRDAIAEMIYGTSQLSVERPWPPKVESPVLDDAVDTADTIIAKLIETGHVIPGAPPAAQILEDAKSFAARLTLSNLALRILNMLAWSNVETPESKPARRWLEDYLEGKNHGPVGQPMLWPGQLPGLCHLLREWGFMPTIAVPGQASYVARAVQAPRVQ